jgi:hypothetical protein
VSPWSRHSNIIRRILQALGYGIGFVIDPENGVREFGYEKPTVVDDLTVTLVRLVGVGMLGVAAFLILSAILVWLGNPAGAYVAMILGGLYVATGLCALRAEWWWDAGFYGGTGASLIVLSAAVGWLHARARGEEAPD